MIGLGYSIPQIAVRQNGTFVQPVNPILAVLAKFGTNAHMWLPGVGTIDGIAAKNWIDSGGVQPASVNDTIGKIDDSGGGSISAIQSVGLIRPALRINENGNYYWEFSGSKYLSLSSPVFQMSDDFCIVTAV